MAAAHALLEHSRAAYEVQDFRGSLEKIWLVLGDTNAYFADQAPWVLRKTDVPRMETVLYVTLEVLRMVSILIQPVMPDAAAKLLSVLGQGTTADDAVRQFAAFSTPLVAGTVLPAPAPIFPKYEEPAEA